MRYDRAWAFLDNEAITASGEKQIDFVVRRSGGAHEPGLAGWGIAQKPQVWMWVGVTESFNRLTNIEFEFEAVGATSTIRDFVPRWTVLLAGLTQGAVLLNQAFPVVEEAIDIQSLRFKYTLTGTAPNAGKITAVLKADQGDVRALVGDVLTERLPSSYDAFPGPSS